MAKLSAKEIIDSLKEMTLLEIKEVVDLMKEEFGVDPSAVAVAAPAAGAATATELGSTPNSSFIISTNSLTSRIVFSLIASIISLFSIFAILYSSLKLFFF